MKTVFQAIMCSIVIHVAYMVTRMVVDYIKTRNYNPDIEGAWENVEILHNEVAFGKSSFPFLYLLTFIVVAVICGWIIFSYKMLVSKQVL
ncbi:hypothetical protein [Metabacillus halosaccharovorans]|uniref:Menaquinol-cytochrome c reductase cytochrome b subunit n=1 Tax=Metabacillus halosaccharovorans TaxID=930124 RepID=A0ABT3DEN1_9BACI|nr:hypothetical protein [Metabacillus halosaccharovorans]MCV9885524.1 hypothetical protein [Metabacillus halosaccharovorans]